MLSQELLPMILEYEGTTQDINWKLKDCEEILYKREEILVQ